MTQGPVLIEIEDEGASPADAPPVPDTHDATLPAIAQQLGSKGGRISRLGRWFVGVLSALIFGMIGVAMWDFVTTMLTERPLLGLIFTVLTGTVALILTVLSGREILAFRRLGALERIQTRVVDARADASRDAAIAAGKQVMGLYHGREELGWKRTRINELLPDQMDGEGVLTVIEAEMMEPLDKAALAEIESASRRVAMATALVPLALVDVLMALAANLRMVRAIAQIYGGRSGTVGSWRLVRAVLAHLVATGAVAIGDDMISSVAGGAVMGKISRRLGEGVINGALTARVGITAMQLCRPMPFVAREKPKTRDVVKRALTGMFSRV